MQCTTRLRQRKRKNTRMKNKGNRLENKESGNEERNITEHEKKNKTHEITMNKESKRKEDKEYQDEK